MLFASMFIIVGDIIVKSPYKLCVATIPALGNFTSRDFGDSLCAVCFMQVVQPHESVVLTSESCFRNIDNFSTQSAPIKKIA